ncbi:hypothetical protein L2E82_00619 [Cichorium intybus]|uniref:Uncharacterized protein n=1 Tax=Cichorium intybus TaxID=13427 RepID=A0ACB9GX24_CICIN|nr:hypothetical protein L2E82_00619 [Cichorium intybus]
MFPELSMARELVGCTEAIFEKLVKSRILLCQGTTYITDQFSRLILNWVFVTMSLDFKISRFIGRLMTSSKIRRLRIQLGDIIVAGKGKYLQFVICGSSQKLLDKNARSYQLAAFANTVKEVVDDREVGNDVSNGVEDENVDDVPIDAEVDEAVVDGSPNGITQLLNDPNFCDQIEKEAYAQVASRSLEVSGLGEKSGK